MFVAFAILILGCDVSTLMPSGESVPTSAPGAVETIIAGTAGAAQSQTAVLVPPTATSTFTPTATRTPTDTPTSTPTFLWLLRSATPLKPQKSATPTEGSGSGAYSCSLLSQTPQDGTKFAPNKAFDTTWKVKNIGTATWEKTSVDFAYISGKKMHTTAVYDLPNNVKVGTNIELTVSMESPGTDGSYKTVWSLRRGTEEFCHVDLSIIVK